MKEELRLVTSLSELRPGMLVVCKPCHICGPSGHRAMITKPLDKWLQGLDGEVLRQEPGFYLEPSPRCHPPNRRSGLSQSHVAAKMVFRVQDGLESTSSDTVRKPREQGRPQKAAATKAGIR